MRTAFAKGLTEKKVIFFHAVRNSLIPIATGIGSTIGLFLAGSYLIEKIFGIDGIGLLTFKAIGTRDYGIIMGFLVIGTIIRLVGNLISDLTPDEAFEATKSITKLAESLHNQKINITIPEDVPADKLTIARSKQVTVKNWKGPKHLRDDKK